MKKRQEPASEGFEQDEDQPTFTQQKVECLDLKQKCRDDFQKERKHEAGMLSRFRNEMKANDLHGKLCREIKSNLTKPENPLNWNPGLALNSDLYCETVKFARQNLPELLSLILGAETDCGEPFTADDIGRFGAMISLFMANSQIIPIHCTSIMKIKTVTSKANGLNDDGLNLLSQSRFSQGSTSAYNMRNEYADFALEMFRKYGSLGTCTGVVDNLAISKNGHLMHFTQGFFSFEHDDLASRHR